jgi:hypothetical protein
MFRAVLWIKGDELTESADHRRPEPEMARTITIAKAINPPQKRSIISPLESIIHPQLNPSCHHIVFFFFLYP